MPIIRPATKSLSTILALTISLFSFGCGGGSGSSGGGGNTPPSTPSTANEWTWVSGSNVGNAKGVYGTLGVAAASNVPGNRMNAVSWIDSSGNLWLFGGVGSSSPTNDLWEFNPSTKQWTWMSGSNGVGSQGLTLPSECVALSWAGLEDFISPRGRRGGGNVGIGFIDFQGLWEGRETARSFSSLSMNRHFHGLPRSA